MKIAAMGKAAMGVVLVVSCAMGIALLPLYASALGAEEGAAGVSVSEEAAAPVGGSGEGEESAAPTGESLLADDDEGGAIPSADAPAAAADPSSEGESAVSGEDLGPSARAAALPAGERVVEDGVYSIACSSSPSYVLDVAGGSQSEGANVTLWTDRRDQRQLFRVQWRDGYYSITALHSGQSLDVVASGCAPGTNVTQWTETGADNQLWALRAVSDGSYELISKCNGLILSAASDNEGSNVFVDAKDADAVQSWSFFEAPAILDGTYFIESALDPSYVLDVVAGSTAEGANVTLWESADRPWQKYRIAYRGDGWYSIAVCHSGQALDVVASGAASPTNVTQWGFWGTDNQLWKPVLNQDGSLSFVSKCNGLFLAVQSGEAYGGANICVSAKADSLSQRFYLEDTSAFLTNYKQYSYSLEQMLNWQRESPYATYSDEEGLRYIDPSNTSVDDAAFFRFVDLRHCSGLTADDLNRRIASTSTGQSGTLLDQGAAFVSAAQRYDVNEAFLLSLAILESGWGTSDLASGTYYDGRGFWCSRWNVSAQASEEVWVDFPGYPAGVYYNYYGIGAIDSDPNGGGIKTAIENGWSSPSAAIAGGAEWISSGYVYADQYPQETLYEMRWDIDRSEATKTRGWHQYSTNLQWDVTAANQIATCYQSAGYETPNLQVIVPVYR